MSEPQIPDWARINVASAARDALILMDEELTDGQYQIDLKAYRALDGGKLTPEAALGYFASKRALYMLKHSLLQKAKQGESAGHRVIKALEADNG